MSSTRIYWSPDEITLVAPLAAALHLKGDCLLYEAVNEAQKVLPVERQRNFYANHLVIQNKFLFAGIEAAKEGKALELKERTQKPKRKVRQKFPDYRNGFIRWTDQENDKIIRGAAELMRDGENDLLTAVCLAQEKELPKGRRRSFKFSANLSKEFRQRIATRVATAPALPPQPAPEIERAPALNWVAGELPTEAMEPVLEPENAQAPINPIQEYMDAILAKLDGLGERLESVEYMQMRLLEALDPEHAPADDLKSLVKDGLRELRKITKRKIHIVGLKSTQFQEIKKVWGEFFNLSYHPMGRDEAISLDRLKHVDYIITTRFINHGIYERIRSTVEKGKHFHVNSPVTEGCKVIEAIFSQQDMTRVPHITTANMGVHH